MIVSLTGFMGCGKSSVGSWLHTALPHFEFIDLDKYVEDKSGRGIPEIFATDGEAAFREIEADCLEEIVARGGKIILALGGGTVMTERCFRLVKEQTLCFYLKASPETIRENLVGDKSLEEAGEERPVLKGKGIEELMALREPVYEAVASRVIETDGRSVLDIANEIFYLI